MKIHPEAFWRIQRKLERRGKSLRHADEEHRKRSILRYKARVSAHLCPQATKYRAAALGCLFNAHVDLRQYKEDKTRFERIKNDSDKPWDQAFLSRVRKNGGNQAYLEMLLSSARYYLETAHQFGELAADFVLP